MKSKKERYHYDLKEIKITVEKPFQRNWLEKRKKQILDELRSDFPLKMDNYITKRAKLSLQIKIVKSTPLMISTKRQAILVIQKTSIKDTKNCCTFLFIWDLQRCCGLHTEI